MCLCARQVLRELARVNKHAVEARPHEVLRVVEGDKRWWWEKRSRVQKSRVAECRDCLNKAVCCCLRGEAGQHTSRKQAALAKIAPRRYMYTAPAPGRPAEDTFHMDYARAWAFFSRHHTHLVQLYQRQQRLVQIEVVNEESVRVSVA